MINLVTQPPNPPWQSQPQQPPYPPQPGQPYAPQYGPAPGMQQPFYPPPKKKHTVRNTILIIVGVIVGLFVLLGACASILDNGGDKASNAAGSSGTATEGKQQSGTAVLKIGDTAVVKRFDGSARVTVSDLVVADGQATVSVKVEVTSGKFTYNELDFNARTKDGRDTKWGDGDLHSGDALAGETVSGTVGFVLPDGGELGIITYTPGFDRIASWSAP